VTDNRISRIQTSVQQLIDTAQGLPAQTLYAEPAPSEWPVMSILAHVVELMPYWAQQALEVSRRSADSQPFGRTHDDPDRIGAVQQHSHDTLDSMLPRLQTACTQAIEALQHIPPEGWKRTARHANRGDMSVEQIVDQFLVTHVEEHLAQARAAITAAASS
jgi:uncharacterized damage-inducible protein DinB